jgi:hypothetical protein
MVDYCFNLQQLGFSNEGMNRIHSTTFCDGTSAMSRLHSSTFTFGQMIFSDSPAKNQRYPEADASGNSGGWPSPVM